MKLNTSNGKQKIVNFLGGPCIGKSTQAAAFFAHLKKLGYNCELVTEYAKDKVWDKHEFIFENQIYIFAKQYQRIYRLINEVDYIVTDSPLIMQLVYFREKNKFNPEITKAFEDLIYGIDKQFENLNINLIRDPELEYQNKGRFQDIEGAKLKDTQITDLLKEFKDRNEEYVYYDVEVGDGTPEKILKLLKEHEKRK